MSWRGSSNMPSPPSVATPSIAPVAPGQQDLQLEPGHELNAQGGPQGCQAVGGREEEGRQEEKLSQRDLWWQWRSFVAAAPLLLSFGRRGRDLRSIPFHFEVLGRKWNGRGSLEGRGWGGSPTAGPGPSSRASGWVGAVARSVCVCTRDEKGGLRWLNWVSLPSP